VMEINADLWETEADARCVTTNGVVKSGGRLVMGAGVAKQARDRYPGIDKRLGDLVKLFGNTPHYLPDIGVMSFPTKHNWRDESDPALIAASAKAAVLLANAHGLKRIVLTRPGCGLGRLDWREVRELLLPILDDRFIVVN
jgi:O-acetyl-ADP-ribose deacetylase (regulator of RNase III)